MNDIVGDQILYAKSHIAPVAAGLLDHGLDAGCVLAAVGSVLGNLVGICIEESDWERAINDMVPIILSDARAAVAMRKGSAN